MYKNILTEENIRFSQSQSKELRVEMVVPEDTETGNPYNLYTTNMGLAVLKELEDESKDIETIEELLKVNKGELFENYVDKIKGFEGNKLYSLWKDGRLYYVFGPAIDLTNNRIVVMYQAMYGDNKYYIRDIDMFQEPISKNREKENATGQKYRFEPVKENITNPSNK